MDALANTDQADVNSLPHALQSAVLSLLSPRTLSVCACVCRGWRELVAEQAWREAFSALWSPPLAAAAAATEPHGWQLSYASRQDAARCWLGRPSTDKLVAHRTAVKACCLLPGRDLLFTGDDGWPAPRWLLAFAPPPALAKWPTLCRESQVEYQS